MTSQLLYSITELKNNWNFTEKCEEILSKDFYDLTVSDLIELSSFSRRNITSGNLYSDMLQRAFNYVDSRKNSNGLKNQSNEVKKLVKSLRK